MVVMNPNRGGEQHTESGDVSAESDGFDRLQEMSIETSAGVESNTGQQKTPSVAQALNDASAVALPQTAIQTDDSSVSPVQQSTALPQDKAHIDKEWVERAKSVISMNQNDPYKQKTEVSKIKADYIQKRFNKVIKTEDVV